MIKERREYEMKEVKSRREAKIKKGIRRNEEGK
jgi:hypothetical protein